MNAPKNGSKRVLRIGTPVLTSGLFFVGLLLAGCTQHPSNEQVQQQTAQATQQVKQTAQHTADAARVAAANAEDKLNAVAAGVKQGLQGGPAASVVDLNSASRDQLVALPGISSARARRIIAGRPYATSQDLVTRNLLTQAQFERISARVKVS